MPLPTQQCGDTSETACLAKPTDDLQTYGNHCRAAAAQMQCLMIERTTITRDYALHLIGRW
jgi:hypothetical protein